LVGGVIGGAAGKKLANNRDKEKIATITGVIIGAVIGNEIGSRMDRLDHQCTGQVLERANDGEWVRWVNEETGARYRVSPYGSYVTDGRHCRKYRSESYLNGRISQRDGAACRNDDGTWEYEKYRI
jgi:surface antigen